MNSFKNFLLEQEDIKIKSIDRSGSLTFLVKGEKYIFSVDSIVFDQKEFKNDLKYRPGKLFNWAKKNGTQIYPQS